MRCGDHVHHWPTGEDWVVAFVDGEHLAWCGWPEGEAKLSDCKLIYACTDEEHVKLLKEIAAANAGRRTRVAVRLLEEMSTHAGTTNNPGETYVEKTRAD